MESTLTTLLLLLALSAAAVSAQRNFTIVRYLNVTTTQGPIRGAVIETRYTSVPSSASTSPRFPPESFDLLIPSSPIGTSSRMCSISTAGATKTPERAETTSPCRRAASLPTSGRRTTEPPRTPEATQCSCGSMEAASRPAPSHESIVTVSLQYRLGVLGFLRLSSTVAPGNMGLKDQALGLEFVHKNIERFGGNLQTVTLMGLDAGAAAVGYHMLNDNTKTYFKRAVMLGGSPMVFWSVRNDTSLVERLHLDFAVRQLSCPLPDQGDFNATIQCLREVSPEKLVNEQLNYNRLFQGVEFPPVIDGDYIKEDPIEAFRNGRFEGMSLMIGVTNAEAAVYVERSLESQKLTQDQLADRATYERVLRDQFRYYERQPDLLSVTGQNVMYDRLTDFGNPSGPAQYKRWLDGASDRLFVSAANEFAEKMSEKNQGTSNDVYFYVFSEQDNTPNYIGASHGSDAYYFFGNPTDDAPIVKPEQADLSVRMMDYLAKFVETGDPVPRDEEEVWAKYNSSHRFYHNFTIDLETFASSYNVPYGFRRDDCGFWDQTLNYVNTLVESSPTTTAMTSTTTSTTTTATTATPEPSTRPPIGPVPSCNFVFNTAAAITLGVLLPTNLLTGAALGFLFFKYNKAVKGVTPV
ncbi:hypothetical protein BOX15_Mlig029545g1 [Macrostomum lignano]|uniref:Carboxylesterase type B domain-containing protein n=1 Tax=Macrostomum lignano TaxID=282301 RepID=A0A267F6Y0_9PLAT|nr:hypothetical protein BOX15_Mlig029545g1 [Macrostomum lignano]